MQSIANFAVAFTAIITLFWASAPQALSQEMFSDSGAVTPWNSKVSDVDFGPLQFSPWWSDGIRQPLNPSGQPMPIDLQTLLVAALDHSKQIKVFSDLPLIRRTSITEADAAFDWRTFVDARWDDTTDPVGNTLTTGGAPEYENQQFAYRTGLRRKNRLGGRVDVSQQFGHQNTNSTFFLPNDQGTARLALNYTQPLMRGRGRAYNEALIVLAKIDTSIACDEFRRQLQSHLLEVTRAYWGLYLERGSYMQKEQVFERALQTLQELESRRGIDAVENQIARARAAVAERKSDLVRAQTAVLNAQERIVALINAPELKENGLELIPQDNLIATQVPIAMDAAVQTAMQSRPEVTQAIKQIKAAGVRRGMAKNELLPQLDLILGTYTAGLQGNSDVFGAWTDQFDIKPSYSVGIYYELPIGNRAAQARLQRRRLEVRQLAHQFDTTVETLLLEVKTAVREVETSFREARAKYQAMEAASRQLEYIQQRWKHLPGEDRNINLYLEDLLNTQLQVAQAEFGFLKAHTTYSLSLMNLNKAQGILLQQEGVESTEFNDGCLPTTDLSKPNFGSVDSDALAEVNAEDLPVGSGSVEYQYFDPQQNP